MNIWTLLLQLKCHRNLTIISANKNIINWVHHESTSPIKLNISDKTFSLSIKIWSIPQAEPTQVFNYPRRYHFSSLFEPYKSKGWGTSMLNNEIIEICTNYGKLNTIFFALFWEHYAENNYVGTIISFYNLVQSIWLLQQISKYRGMTSLFKGHSLHHKSIRNNFVTWH